MKHTFWMVALNEIANLHATWQRLRIIEPADSKLAAKTGLGIATRAAASLTDRVAA